MFCQKKYVFSLKIQLIWDLVLFEYMNQHMYTFYIHFIIQNYLAITYAEALWVFENWFVNIFTMDGNMPCGS